jgi:hypothetical protein
VDCLFGQKLYSSQGYPRATISLCCNRPLFVVRRVGCPRATGVTAGCGSARWPTELASTRWFGTIRVCCAQGCWFTGSTIDTPIPLARGLFVWPPSSHRPRSSTLNHPGARTAPDSVRPRFTDVYCPGDLSPTTTERRRARLHCRSNALYSPNSHSHSLVHASADRNVQQPVPATARGRMEHLALPTCPREPPCRAPRPPISPTPLRDAHR